MNGLEDPSGILYKKAQIEAFKALFEPSNNFKDIHCKRCGMKFSYYTDRGLKSAITKCFKHALWHGESTFNKQVIFDFLI